MIAVLSRTDAAWSKSQERWWHLNTREGSQPHRPLGALVFQPPWERTSLFVATKPGFITITEMYSAPRTIWIKISSIVRSRLLCLRISSRSCSRAASMTVVVLISGLGTILLSLLLFWRISYSVNFMWSCINNIIGNGEHAPFISSTSSCRISII